MPLTHLRRPALSPTTLAAVALLPLSIVTVTLGLPDGLRWDSCVYRCPQRRCDVDNEKAYRANEEIMP